ncbi:GNAT family N-acetyltransferase [Pararhizobium haloflavum]|uniref:GNAT family N-acetyltransferase n=1 Tax=Pararhizobium haloflavum TaxID=2037914 RepID=UPI000C17CA4C|nr:GNAT family N-acetyltransferase [Pararhizobium haloflavum]
MKTSGPALAIVRRLEAVSFRAWPAALVKYDGTWQTRLTAGHPSRRLNSVNALDPSDAGDIEPRVARAVERFDAYGRLPVFRQTPLSPVALDDYLAGQSWQRVDETLVLMADISALDLDDALDQLPLRDVARYVDVALAVQGRDPALRSGMMEVLNAIRPAKGMFITEAADREATATALCVHDNDMAGIFELATRADLRRMGHGHAIVKTALRWARLRGAKSAWLQVEAANVAAIALYQRFGFEEIYRYAYRQPARKD